MTTALLFPGQGAQVVSMGKDVYDAHESARKIFDIAEDVSGLPLKKLCFEGPQEDLSRTDMAQPAIFTVSAAMMAVMQDILGDKMPASDFTAGLSLGEYTALYAAGAMDLETGIKLVTRRGRAMQAAAEAAPSSMICVIGMDEAQATELCEAASEGETLTPANFNCPGQIVLSGAIGACQRAGDKAKDFGASAAKMLDVAGAFHSRFMASAADELALALEDVTFDTPKVPVLSNVDAKPHTSSDDIKQKLLAQLVSPVRWQHCMEYLIAANVDKFVEIGPGKVLAGLMRRIQRRSDFTSVNAGSVIDKLAQDG